MIGFAVMELLLADLIAVADYTHAPAASTMHCLEHDCKRLRGGG